VATKINMPKKAGEVLPQTEQKPPLLLRYWLQVDRQTKNSFETFKEAETAGKAIKKWHPKLQVSIYDAEKSQQTLIAD
jgi:hypothetical protein